MSVRVDQLRDAAVALRRDWEEPNLEGRWSDVVVWFGTLGLLGPRATRGVGAFASFVAISRTWAAAHRRHTRSVNHVVGLVTELVAEDLEDRAAVDDAVDELAGKVARLEQAGQRAASDFPRYEGDTIVLGPECFADTSLSVINYRGENFMRDGDQSVRITRDEARALRASPRGETFVVDHMDSALAKIDAFLSPQSDEERGPVA